MPNRAQCADNESVADIIADARAALARVREDYGDRADSLEHLVIGSELKLGLRETPGALTDLPLATRLQHGLRIVDGELPQAPGALKFVNDALTAAYAVEDTSAHATVGLALWAGWDRAESRFDDLLGPHKVMAVERCLAGGVPPELAPARAFVQTMLPAGAATEAATLSLFRGRFERDEPHLDHWLDIASIVHVPTARAQLLLELAVQVPDAGDHEQALLTMAQSGLDEATSDMESWPGQIGVLSAGVMARAQGAGGEGLDVATAQNATRIERGWKALESISDTMGFHQAWTALLLAESQRGLEPWRQAVERIGRDRAVKSHHLMADLAYDAAGIARWVRGTDDERSAALSPVSDLLTRIHDPGRQTAGWAAFAEASANAVGRTAASAFTRVENAAAKMTQSGERLQILPRVARLCGQADLEGARQLVRVCMSDTEQVVAGLSLAEVAAGIRR